MLSRDDTYTQTAHRHTQIQWPDVPADPDASLESRFCLVVPALATNWNDEVGMASWPEGVEAT